MSNITRLSLGESKSILLYHGSSERIEYPEIRISNYCKDFGFGFYCTKIEKQAQRWVRRRHRHGFINYYKYTENPVLKKKYFDGVSEEWLDFVIHCRTGGTHPYDIVEGPMTDDTVFTAI